MILTLTPNPSIDRTIDLAEPLVRGAVHRVTATLDQAGGKRRHRAQGQPEHRRHELSLPPGQQTGGDQEAREDTDATHARHWYRMKFLRS